MNRLVMYAPAPVVDEGATVRLDAKFVSGMREHCARWPGEVRCLLRLGAPSIPFGLSLPRSELGFELVLLAPDEPAGPKHLDGAAAVFAAADDAGSLHLVPLAHAVGARIVYSLEYTIGTRLEIARLDRDRSPPRRLWSAWWHVRQEIRRRRAIRAADGLQANGYPAFDLYRKLNKRTMIYLDGRMTPELLATGPEMAARRARLLSGAPLRLVHSGRLEPMKGAQDLVPVMRALRAAGVAATLDVYGTGGLERAVAAAAAAAGLGDVVRLHGPVDFETGLVPAARSQADIFLSCHRQSDPSCSYIEAMGCGLAVAGYANHMWLRLAGEAGAGAVAPMARPRLLAERIAELDRNRAALAEACERSLSFSRAHDFPTEFTRRMDHLKAVTRAG
jgi:glycosyltransferase involved in cell wall biosynthesis